MKALAVLGLVCLIPALALADFQGLVVGVSDGDTISVMHDGKAEKNSPERY